RLEQLDLAATDREQRGAHALVFHRRLLRDPEAERVPPEGEPVLETADDETDVMDTRQHARLTRTRSRGRARDPSSRGAAPGSPSPCTASTWRRPASCRRA